MVGPVVVFWTLVWIPVWGLPFGVIGAAVGNGQRLGTRGRGPGRGTGRDVIPNVDHAAVGYLLMLVGLVETPISLLLWNRYDPGKRRARLIERRRPVGR